MPVRNPFSRLRRQAPDASAVEAAADGVVPAMAELVALRAAVRARKPARRGQSAASGPSLSPMRGRGMEYAESREYVAGDDVRHIDWRLTARSGKTHTKLFQAERERITWLLADTAPALYFGTRRRFKSVQAARMGAVATWAALREGDRLGALRGSRREAALPPTAGAQGVLRVLGALARWYAEPLSDDAGLATALELAARMLRPGSRLIVLADAASAAAIADARWLQLAARNEVIVLLPVDPLETDPPHARLPFESHGPAGDRRIELDLGDDAVRARWQAQFSAPLADMLATLRRCGVRAAAVATDAPSESWLSLLDAPQARVA